MQSPPSTPRPPGTLLILTGAPGSGKTTVLPALRAALPGVVVLDLDDFLDAGGRLAGVDMATAADAWPAYTELCLRLVDAVTGSGVDCLLLCPLDEGQVDRPARWAVLDCADDVRRARLRARGTDEAGIEAAVADAAALRHLTRIGSDGTVAATAAAIAGWARIPAGAVDPGEPRSYRG